MKKRIAFRLLTILLATALLLSSTGAYNLLVYANQDSVANSLSAIESASSSSDSEPSISTHGGELQLNADETDTTDSSEDENTGLSYRNNGTGDTVTPGSSQNPFIIAKASDLLLVQKYVNEDSDIINTEKHFVLEADIDLSSLFADGALPFVNSAGNAYIVSADPSDPDSQVKYINLDGEGHKIYIGDSTVINITNYTGFALFGYLSKNSVIKNVVFENINVSVSTIDPNSVAIISYKNEGTIENCEINGCSLSLSQSSVNSKSHTIDSVEFGNGVAAAVVDNRGTLTNVNVNSFTVDIPSAVANDYIAGLVAQNLGTISGSSVSGIKMTVHDATHYIGGLVAINEAGATVTNSSVVFGGSGANINAGGNVGGLVGWNNGTISQSSVTGTMTSAQTPSSSAYNMTGKSSTYNGDAANFGGVTAVNCGEINTTTVSDVGFYMSATQLSGAVSYFGGIAAVSKSTSSKIENCVASGSFAASNYAECYAGGILGYADSNAADGSVIGSYALFRLSNPAKELVGAVIGYGGTALTASGCYWSDAISGCVTSYVIPDTNSSLPPAINQTEGKLFSANRAVVVARGASTVVSASELTHSFGVSGAATVSVNSDVTVDVNASNNSLVRVSYAAQFSFPSGVGADAMQNLDVGINLDVLVTTGAGDPDEIDNPFVIKSTAMAKFLYLAPYGHYKLASDISVSASEWTSANFTGTLNGGDNIIAANTSIFRYVIGDRTAAADWSTDDKTVPATEVADRKMGYIYDLNVDLSDNISTSVLGSSYDAALVNIALTDGDPTADDGNIGSGAAFEGYGAVFTENYKGAFINFALGSSYIYGCSSDVSVNVGSQATVAGFIAVVGSATVVDNCAVTNMGVYISSSTSNTRAAFIADVSALNSSNKTGAILNSVVSAQIIGSGSAYIIFGGDATQIGQFNTSYKNITWSKGNYFSSGLDTILTNLHSGFVLWGSGDRYYSSTNKVVSPGSNTAYSVALPQNVSVFSDCNIGDFSVSLVNITDSAETALSEDMSALFSIIDTTVNDKEITVNVSVADTAAAGSAAWLKIFHFETGFVTYVKFTVNIAEFQPAEDGYYHIYTPEDLVKFSELTHETSDGTTYPYTAIAVKLENDIDMTGIAFTPIAQYKAPFSGLFDGQGHTIYGLTIQSTSAYQALFAAAVGGADITLTGSEVDSDNNTVSAGIKNLVLDGADISGGNGVAAVVAATNANKAVYPLSLSNIHVYNSKISSSGSFTAAVLGYASTNKDLTISQIVISNVEISTSKSSNIFYFKEQSTTAVIGIGGVIGNVNDTSSSDGISVKISEVEIYNLNLAGATNSDGTKGYAMANAGAVIGAYQKYNETVGTLDIKKVEAHNVVIKSAGIAGGLVGATNAKTSISNCLISGDTVEDCQILSTTDLYIGGIAGYVGTFSSDAATASNAFSNKYGSIDNCVVENVYIAAVDSAISSETTTLTRNVAVGGIVGAINGPQSGDAVSNCTVNNSIVSGVVVGGIVGSNVQRELATASVNRLHVNNCTVTNSQITTPEECYPAVDSTTAIYATVYGVGGIVGTNRRYYTAYANDFAVINCTVDDKTTIENHIPYQFNGSTTVRVATGGIVGSAFVRANESTKQILLEKNQCAATITSDGKMTQLTSPVNAIAPNAVSVATGGLIGLINGTSVTDVLQAAYLQAIQVKNGVFSGEISAHNVIGGVIGAVWCAYSRTTEVTTAPKDLLSNIAVLGKLTNESADANYVSGGIAIGTIVYSLNSTVDTSSYNHGLSMASDTAASDAVSAINNIYFSSFGIDNQEYPLLGYFGASRTGVDSILCPVTNAAKATLYGCYYDINLKDGNQSKQFNDVSSGEKYSIPNETVSAPLETKGSAFTAANSVWKTSNSGIAEVTSEAYNELTVSPKNKGNVEITVDYIGKITSADGTWSSASLALSAGFIFESTNQNPLDTVTVDYDGDGTAETYHIISDPIDFKILEAGDADILARNYWVANDIEFTEDMFAANGNYNSGFAPIGTASYPFTGSISSMPQGTFTSDSDSNKTYSNANGDVYRISGIVYTSKIVYTYKSDTNNSANLTVAGLFGCTKNAEFSNLIISDSEFEAVSGKTVDYAAAVAAIAEGSLKATNIVVENASIVGANYSGGLFGGLFSADTTFAIPWSIIDCALAGENTGSDYSTVVSAKNGAAGIVVHTDKNSAVIKNVAVSGASIIQSADSADSTYYDNGAAGIAFAYAGTISADDDSNNIVKNCYIEGEIVAGAVVRAYTSSTSSSNAYLFASAGVRADNAASMLSISDVDIIKTSVVGTVASLDTDLSNRFTASAGILARVDVMLDSATKATNHKISNCTLDSDTVVSAPYAAGGILGCFESANSAANTYNYFYGIEISDCSVAATVKTTQTEYIISSSTNNYKGTGCGGVIGYFSDYSTLSYTTIKNCAVTGTISGESPKGGLIGAFWNDSSPDSQRFDNMSTHFAENCVVTADFTNSSGVDAFAKSSSTTGILVGHVFDASDSESVIFNNVGFTENVNEPFFNIYYSGYKYDSGLPYLFGVINPGTAATQYSLNYSSSVSGNYSCYTGYAYELNYYDAEQKIYNAQIDTASHSLVFAQVGRITPPAGSNENGVWVLDYRFVQSGYTFNFSDLTFNSATDDSLNYTFTLNDLNNPLAGFVLKGRQDNAPESSAELVGVESDNSKVNIEWESGSTVCEIIPQTLTETAAFNLVFVYSNGVELAVPVRIVVSGNDYYYSGETGSRTFYVFNASNLYSTMQQIGSGETIIQAFDVFCALSDLSLAAKVNKYTASVTLSDVYSEDTISAIAATMHPNPDYDKDVDSIDRLNISILEYLGVTEAEFSTMSLSRLVKEITELSFGDFEQDYSQALYNNAFAGTYQSLASTADSDERGLGTSHYAVYGLELHSLNATAQGSDGINVGMFASLASGAKILNATFVNPKIEVVTAKGEENFVGVLAGKAQGATITNVSVINTDSSNKANAYVKNIRRMTAASANVGGVVGSADAATVFSGVTVSGLDVVGATLAGNVSGSLQTVSVGAVAGVNSANISSVSVSDSRVLAERNDRYRTSYMSYAGGVAGKASGEISDAEISNLVLRDCTCEVSISGGQITASTYTVDEESNELVLDRAGGVAGYGSGTLKVTGASLDNIDITSFDAAGGLVAELASSASTAFEAESVQITNADIRMLSSNVLQSSSANRVFYNAVGGVVGAVNNLTTFSVKDADIIGYVGTYSYDNMGKEATAGGIIGAVSEELSSLDAISIYSVSVQGEVAGFRGNRTVAESLLGAAGGFIGKINCAFAKTNTDCMISESVMSATVNLYSSSSGTTVKATLEDATNANVNVGKLLGAVNSTEFDSADFTKYCKNIIVSSYPQDIAPFGNMNFYNSQVDSSLCYTDINVYTYKEEQVDESGNSVTVSETDNSFMIGGFSVEDVSSVDAASTDTYSSLAIIPVDLDAAEPVSMSRYFRLQNNNLTFADTKTVSFEAENADAKIVLSGEGTTDANVTVSSTFANPYGVLTISDVKEEIIGEISVSYNYGLQVGVQFIGMEIDGKGTAQDPFQIARPNHFAVVRALRDAYYIQVADIDLSSQYGYSVDVTSPLWADGSGFEPIGTKSSPFVGGYDGQGHIISNLYISRVSEDNVGFFGYVGSVSERAQIKNIHIEIADGLEISADADDLETVTTVSGVVGASHVAGLIGYSNGAVVTNCSVSKGTVMGKTAVGGLVGRSYNSDLTSCFTSTTTASYYDNNNSTITSSYKTVGALIGTVSSATTVQNSFTMGYASAGVKDDENYGVAGGIAGYAGAGATLSLSHVFVGATVSDYVGTGTDVKYKGLTVGGADEKATVTVDNMFISAPTALTYSTVSTTQNAINPVLGRETGPEIGENVRYNSDIIGDLSLAASTETKPETTDSEETTDSTDSTASTTYYVEANEGFNLNGISLGINDIDDEYTAAYVELAGVALTVDEQEISDRNGSAFRGGLFYPVKFAASGWTLNSSVMDTTDTEPYPEGIDLDFYGNGDNKNVDLLFKNEENAVEVHLNVFNDNGENYNTATGELYSNGEFFNDCMMPYFTATKIIEINSVESDSVESDSVESSGVEIELYRKYVYPVQTRYDIGRAYPLSTERQLTALSVPEAEGTKFADLKLSNSYALTENINITEKVDSEGNVTGFKPISGFTGSFNGNGKAITNLLITSSSDDNVGLFSTLTKGTVKNLTITVKSVSGNNNVGALAGYIAVSSDAQTHVVIDNCTVINAEGGEGVNGNQNVGGLIGYASSESYDAASYVSESSSAVTVSGVNVVGGLIGYDRISVSNSYSTGDVNAAVNGESGSVRGIGGLLGVFDPIAPSTLSNSTETPLIVSASFSSSIVDVIAANGMSGYDTSSKYGIGGLIGYVNEYASISTVFSSGNVRYCYEASSLPSCSGVTLGIGGLVGIMSSKVSDVYSAASVASDVGDVSEAANVGIGGVVGLAEAQLMSAYSSGSTLGTTTTQDTSACNFGVGGVIGVIADNDTARGDNLYFDKNVSILGDTVVGKAPNGKVENNLSKTTKEMTDGTLGTNTALGNSFGYDAAGAYPYLKAFFGSDISRVIQFNALLSIVAIQLNELDQTAAEGKGISMAMTIPTGVTYNSVTYAYGFEADNSEVGSATSIVDEKTNSLSIQRTSNDSEQANFLITIKAVNSAAVDEDGTVYSTVASRQLSRLCAQMSGTQEYPYLVASQEDLSHVAMSSDELGAVPVGSYYAQWNTPQSGDTVYYRMMGHISLSNYSRSFSVIDGKNYSFDGNGYELRGLTSALDDVLNENSIIKNINVVDVNFGSGEEGTVSSLIGTVNGTVEGISVSGTASGSNVAGIAQVVGETGVVKGCVSNLAYSDSDKSDIAGLALVNNGTVELSASVGSFSGTGLTNVSGLVAQNNATIKNSFTMGDFKLDAPKGVIGGFVGANNGSIEYCYTRCNFLVTNADAAPSIGLFAAENSAEKTISGAYASGLFDVRKADGSAADLSTIFVGNNSGTVTSSLLDKQMSGTCFKDDFWYAEHTADVISLANHPGLVGASGYTLFPKSSNNGSVDYADEYPQLSAILATEQFETDADGNVTETETVTSRMYRTLRSYSDVSAATAIVENDNYIDNLPHASNTVVSLAFKWDLPAGQETSAGEIKGYVDPLSPKGKYFVAADTDCSSVLSTTVNIDDYYNYGSSYTFNLYIKVTNGQNPNFAGGTGTENDPFQITKKEHIIALSYYGLNASSFYKVMNDIDMTMESDSWPAYINTFKANLDGNGKVLANVTIPADGCGALIGTLDGGTVTNLGLANADITYSGNDSAAMLAAKVNDATITNCFAVGVVNASTGSAVGGLVGTADGTTVIDGCVTSGKIDSGAANVGGIVGQSIGTTTVSNSLSSALVSGGTNVGGIIGGMSTEAASATVTNTVFAGNVLSGTNVGNISGSSAVTIENSYFDKQFTSVGDIVSDETAATTYYLTAGESAATFGDMARFADITTYPVPAEFVNSSASYSALFIESIKLAAAKITLVNGISSGTISAFTTGSAPATIGSSSAVLSTNDETYLTIETNTLVIDTSEMTLSEKAKAMLLYTMTNTTAVAGEESASFNTIVVRYVDLTIGKQVKSVDYVISGLPTGSCSIISVITGSGSTKSAATAFDKAGSGSLCKDMVFAYETLEDGSVKLFTVDTELPAEYKQGEVTVEFYSGTTCIKTVTADSADDGTCDIAVPSDIAAFDSVKITVSAQEHAHEWGIHKHIGLFVK